MLTTIIILFGLFLIVFINVNLTATMKKQKKTTKQRAMATKIIMFSGLSLIIAVVVIVNLDDKPNQVEVPDEYVAEQQKIETIEEKLFKAYQNLRLASEGYEFNTTQRYQQRSIDELGEILISEEADTEMKNRVKKTIDSLMDAKIKLADQKELDDRKNYQNRLRNNFLDAGYDIKVQVSGKDNRTIKLTYVLFNDVWFRKFETGGEFMSLRNLGYTKIIMSDGYRYNKTYNTK